MQFFKSQTSDSCSGRSELHSANGETLPFLVPLPNIGLCICSSYLCSVKCVRTYISLIRPCIVLVACQRSSCQRPEDRMCQKYIS